ncbi:hypothetical protein MLD38_031595 [Melastoma candidum]|nr:hypothetical protein MLD38_031595 [Melastoma candidum]
MVSPGQTTTVLLTVERSLAPSGVIPMAITPYVTSVFPFDNSTAVGFFQYESGAASQPKSLPVNVPNLPKMIDTEFATEFSNRLRSLATYRYPCRVPRSVDKQVIVTISLNLQDCPLGKTCRGYAGKRFLASMNNQSFVRPPMSILEHHYKNLSTSDALSASTFPEKPPESFDYTGVNPVTENMNTKFGSKVLVVPYGTNLEMVLQDTGFLNKENHPIHVHGHNFFIVGQGFGNFDGNKDPANYNLVDPPERNTIAVPMGGWAAIRLKADNPGAWFVHCHLEVHNSWGLAMAFIVLDGLDQSQRLLPPPHDLPSC